MKCPSCKTDNPDENKFCRECGTKLVLLCPGCGTECPPGDKFCGKCGQSLAVDTTDAITGPAFGAESTPGMASHGPVAGPAPTTPAATPIEGDRRNVTVFFSDLSGYTAMSENLDPEEVQEIMSRIFGRTAQIVAKYEGYIDKFIGDAVMVLFGVPKAHEDDPIRAVRAALEIHEYVDALSPEIEEKIGRPLRMHTGINTGIVVTGNIDLEKGTERVLGDTINVASRLTNLATAGEIFVGDDTYHQAEGYFNFDVLEPTKVKGKAEAVAVYKFVSVRERPVTVHHLSGLKSTLIGRNGEMAQLTQAVERLYRGKGTVVAISGEAGTGKSRLVDEFKAGLDLEKIQWREGYAYAYSQNVAYFQLMDLLSRAWHIEESDPPERVKRKLDTGIGALLGETEKVLPYIGSLYSLDYPEIEQLDPQFKKTRLTEYIKEILAALCKQGPTIIHLEDLHWADPTSVDLLRSILTEFQYPALFLCVYRPPFSFFSSHTITGMGESFLEIELKNLSYSETQEMLESLLKSKHIPPELVRFVQEKVEGYPFYLEEIVNTLIGKEVLVKTNGSWEIRGRIEELDIPTTIHGIITARLDMLEKEPKRIIQEASVIGRAFFYDILQKVSDLHDKVDSCLRSLEMVDLIRTRALSPDIEYIFKHALTQEVIYNGLLKRERQMLHEKVACVIEQFFQNRLPEFYETLAYHYKNGQSREKAIDYLVKSAEKSMRRYAVEEAHLYYKEAFAIIKPAAGLTGEGIEKLLKLIVDWCFVYYFRGDFGEMHELLTSHEELAKQASPIETPGALSTGGETLAGASPPGQTLPGEAVGMFTAWLGFSHYFQDEHHKAYDILQHVLRLGEECGSKKVTAYAYTWLAFPCYELGRYKEGVTFGESGHNLAKEIGTDDYLYFKSLGGIGNNSIMLGKSGRCLEIGKGLLTYGEKRSNTRATVVGHICIGYGHQARGDLQSAIDSMKIAYDTSIDPFYSIWPLFALCFYYCWIEQFDEAYEAIEKVMVYSEGYGCKAFEKACKPFLGVPLMARGEFAKGMDLLESGITYLREHDRLYFLTVTEYILGRVYLQITEGKGIADFSTAVKNIGFIASNVPFAAKKSEEHFNKALKVADETGAVLVTSFTCLELARLHHVKGRKSKARECLDKAIKIFEQNEADAYLDQARELLAKIE